MASQSLFGRPHRRDGSCRLMLRFRELIESAVRNRIAPNIA